MIIEFCGDLKTDVQLAKELKIKELESMSVGSMFKELKTKVFEDSAEVMMNHIDKFQREKLQSLLNANNKDDFNSKQNEMNATLLKHSKQLDNTTMFDNKLDIYNLESQVATL